ncbi:hypothetical protein ONZ51_g8933 [Trametes cubensis]|uniref:Thioesterase domain-containing protein n=1 Tax=Trametes cubensis TaxID=1111947 RepID=A0AAD7TP78_9APHY|nr:hypothetical protein ONZ51_g8933 [Trametes cubensis]
MSPDDKLRHLRSFPRAPAPNDNIAAVKSNLPDDLVELQQNILAYHVAHHPGSSVFGHDQAKGLKLVELYVRSRSSEEDSVQKSRQSLPPGTENAKPSTSPNPNPSPKLKVKVKPRTDDLEALTVCEVDVQDGKCPSSTGRRCCMLNVHGTLAGPCLTLFLDVASFSALFALGTVVNMDPSGFSTSMNIVWHAAATRGMTLRFVNRSLSLTPRMGAARCEVYDKKTARLLASATQIVSPIPALPSSAHAAAAAQGQTQSPAAARITAAQARPIPPGPKL